MEQNSKKVRDLFVSEHRGEQIFGPESQLHPCIFEPQVYAAAANTGSLTQAISSAGSATIEHGTNYCLRNAKSSLYLDVDGAGTVSGTNCSQQAYTGEAQQVWYAVTSPVSGYMQFIPRNAPTMRLTVLDTGTGNVGIRTADSSLTTQDWALVKNARGCHVLKSRCSNQTKALSVDPGNALTDGANILQISYTDDANLNDEWFFEPYILLFMEFDQGLYMYHSIYSGQAIQDKLKQSAQLAAAAFYHELGLRAGIASEMMPSLPDDCQSMLHLCEHSDYAGCTNTYDSREDVGHHTNFSKEYYWYSGRGRFPNAIQVLWSGHTKCLKSGTAASTHAYFNLGKNYYYTYIKNAPFVVMNLPVNVVAEQLAAYLIQTISGAYGLQFRSHSTQCIMDPNCNTQTIYNAVMGPNPTLSSFWCGSDKAALLASINQFSKSAF